MDIQSISVCSVTNAARVIFVSFHQASLSPCLISFSVFKPHQQDAQWKKKVFT